MVTQIVYEKVHYRHDVCWLLSDPGGQDICLACIMEMAEDGEVAVVRKKHVLSIFQMVLKIRASEVTQILANDGRICAHFIETLLGLLLSMEDGSALDLVTEILVQLIANVKVEEFCHCILDKCHKELLDFKSNYKASLHVFIFMGKLVDSLPSLADCFVTEHYELIEYMLQCLLYPHESLKTAICYLYGKLYCSPTTAQKLSTHFSESLCGPFLATLETAQTQELQINCMGLLKQLLEYDYFVTVVMNESGCQRDSESTPLLQAQNPLPLVMKKVLLNGDEFLQIASVQCITAIIVHYPTKYAPAFITADIPELLFEYLGSTNEFLVWSIYCCLLLMTDEKLLFSKCHTVYGIEALVRSLKDVLQRNNEALLKQGLLLLAEIFERQPTDIKLFANPGIFKTTTDVILEAVSFPVLDVSLQATKCASAFFRSRHLTTPVHYGKLQKLVNKVLEHCADCALPPVNRRPKAHQPNKEKSRNITKQGQLLTYTLQTFQNACRLAVECQSNPHAQENAFVAPDSESEDTLERFSCFLLEMCDNICIPTVMKYYESAPLPAAMDIFYSLLCDMCVVVPIMKTTFCMKLASASFIRLAMEVKYNLCSGFRNPNLNQTCSTFLGMLCSTLWPVLVDATVESRNDVSDVLQRSLVNLSGSVPECVSLLSAMPCADKNVRCEQYALLVIFCVAFIAEDRFIKETDLFSAILGFLHSLQCNGDHFPSYVIKATFFLLAVCQEQCEDLNSTSVNLICKILEDAQDIKLLHFHHPFYLKFFFRYPQLMENYGCSILTFWILNEDPIQICEDGRLSEDCKISELTKNQGYLLPLLNILQSNHNSIPVFLDLLIRGPSELSHKVLLVFKVFLKGNVSSFASGFFANQLLNVLQKILIQSTDAELQVCNISGKSIPSNLSILRPAFNFMYCSLHQANETCRMRGTAMLLSNVSFIELIQKILDLTWDYSFTSNENLCSSACLITSSLVSYQKAYNLEYLFFSF